MLISSHSLFARWHQFDDILTHLEWLMQQYLHISRYRAVKELLRRETPNFISHGLWSPNCRDLSQLTIRYGRPCRNVFNERTSAALINWNNAANSVMVHSWPDHYQYGYGPIFRIGVYVNGNNFKHIEWTHSDPWIVQLLEILRTVP